MTKNTRRGTGNVFIAAGLLLMAAALLLTGYNLWDENRAADHVESVVEKLAIPDIKNRVSDSDPILNMPEKTEEAEIPDYKLNPNMKMPTVQVDGEEYIGRLDIPVLELSVPVMDQWDYKKLKLSPCRYEGSVYMDDLIIAAHNYRTHFGGIKKLIAGDEVIFTDVDGNMFYYSVVGTEVLGPYEIEEMREGNVGLTLFSCTYGGSSRVTVRCELIEEIPVT